MSLESATYLDDLVATNPEGSDLKSEGDDHIRLLKDVLQNTFPGMTAAVTFGTGVDLNKDVLAKTADYVVLDADKGKLIVVDATADNVVITLPTASANAGTVLFVKKTDATANTVTLDGEGSETIDSALTLVIDVQYIVEGVWCDGTEWHRLVLAAETSSAGYASLPDVKAINQSLVSGASPTFVTTNFTDATDKRLMTDAQETVLDSVETNADVTDFTNVQLAGAVMDSEVTNLTDVKTFDPADYATAAQGATADTALQSVAAADISDATADGIALVTSADANPFTDADESKLDGIAVGATVGGLTVVEQDATGGFTATNDNFTIVTANDASNVTLPASGSSQRLAIYNDSGANLSIVPAGADTINTVSSFTIAHRSGVELVIGVTDTNWLSDVKYRSDTGMLSALEAISGVDLSVTQGLAANAVQPGDLVSGQANNTLSANPLFWSGTEANYALLTPVSGTLYFTTA